MIANCLDGESGAELNMFAAGDIVVCATSVEATESMKGHLVRTRWRGDWERALERRDLLLLVLALREQPLE